MQIIFIFPDKWILHNVKLKQSLNNFNQISQILAKYFNTAYNINVWLTFQIKDLNDTKSNGIFWRLRTRMLA